MKRHERAKTENTIKGLWAAHVSLSIITVTLIIRLIKEVFHG